MLGTGINKKSSKNSSNNFEMLDNFQQHIWTQGLLKFTYVSNGDLEMFLLTCLHI